MIDWKKPEEQLPNEEEKDSILFYVVHPEYGSTMLIANGWFDKVSGFQDREWNYTGCLAWAYVDKPEWI